MTRRAGIHSADTAGEGVLRAVSAARRRLRFVNTLRLVAIAGPSGVAAGAACALAGWMPDWTPIVAGVLGAAAATAWGAARTPSPATVARILDAHLELKDRVSAALQLRERGGPIAALVARDAMARLAGIKLRTLFPVTIDRAPAIATAAAVAMSAWLVVSDTDAVGSVGGTTSASNSASTDTSTPARGAARTSAAGSNDQTTDQRSVATAREPRQSGSDSQPAREESLASDAGASIRTPAAAGDTSGAAASGARDSDNRSTPSSAAATARTGGGGSAAGQTPTGGVAAGAGGAAPGNAPLDAARDARGHTAIQAFAASYHAARAAAEAALARDVIPPDYREHVRAYFSAVSPGTGPVTSNGGPR